jgi:hypothetical protein
MTASTFEALGLDGIATPHSDGAHKVRQRWGTRSRGASGIQRGKAQRECSGLPSLSNGQREDVYAARSESLV